MKRLAATAFALAVFVLVLVGITARVLDTALLPSLRTPAVSVIYDRHGTELARLLPSAANSAGPAGASRPVTGRVPATLVSLEAMAPAFVAAATTVTQSQNLRVSAPELLERLWNGVTGDPVPASTVKDSTAAGSTAAGTAAGTATGTGGQPDAATLAELYVELTEPGVAPISGAQPKSINDRLSTALLTNRVEREFSEPELLELYLNVASYGRNAYGASAAAQTWFGISIADLNVGQAAFLAAWLDSPLLLESSGRASNGASAGTSNDTTASSSVRSFTGASSDTAEQFAAVTEARNAVLFEMYEADDITAAELEDARATRIDELLLPYQPATQVELLVNDAELAPVINTVLAELVDRYGARAVTFGGLHVVTTIDLPYQRTGIGSAIGGAIDSVADTATTSTADVLVLDDTGGVRAAVGDVFTAAHRNQELTTNLLPGGEALLSSADTTSVLDVATAFSVLSHDGVLRPTHLVLSVGTAPPFELLQQLSQRNSGVSEEVLATAANAISGVAETERHVINRVRVMDQTEAEQLTAGLMQPFAQLVAQLIAVSPTASNDVPSSDAPGTDSPGTDSPDTDSSSTDSSGTSPPVADLLTTDLPVLARIVSPLNVPPSNAASSSDASSSDGSSSGAAPNTGSPNATSPNTTPPNTTSPGAISLDATSWLAGWSDQSLVVMRISDSVADNVKATELTTTFATLMQGLHYWSLP